VGLQHCILPSSFFHRKIDIQTVAITAIWNILAETKIKGFHCISWKCKEKFMKEHATPLLYTIYTTYAAMYQPSVVTKLTVICTRIHESLMLLT